jgi:hypothetical protein
MPTVLIDTLKRGGSGISPFPTTQETDAKLSYLTVADIPGRDALAEWKRLPFMRVHVISNNTDYRLGVDVTIAGQVWTAVTSAPDGAYQLVAEKNQPSGYVGLGIDGKIDPAYIKNIYTNNSYVVASLVDRNNLNTLTGDIIVTTDTSQIWVKLNNNVAPAVNGDFAELQFPGSVLSVNGQVGVVSITIANLIAVAQNAIDLNTFINNNVSVTALNGITATHTIEIAQLQADILLLEAAAAGPAVIPTYDTNTIYTLNQAVKYQESSGRFNLYVANNSVPVSNVPGVSGLWTRIGNYYTVEEVNAALLLKADLVGGTVPLNQLPAAAKTMSYIAANFTERNAITPQVTGMRVYVTANATKWIYQPGHSLADAEGFVEELGEGGGADLFWTEAPVGVEIAGGTNYLATGIVRVNFTVGANYPNKVVKIVGKDIGGWKLTCTSPVTIRFLDEVIATSIESTNAYDAIELLNIDTNTWQVIGAVGNLNFIN